MVDSIKWMVNRLKWMVKRIESMIKILKGMLDWQKLYRSGIQRPAFVRSTTLHSLSVMSTGRRRSAAVRRLVKNCQGDMSIWHVGVQAAVQAI